MVVSVIVIDDDPAPPILSERLTRSPWAPVPPPAVRIDSV